MSSTGKRRWESQGYNCPRGYGSAPTLLSPPHTEGSGIRFLKKRFSMDTLRGWAHDLGSLSMGLNLNLGALKWPRQVPGCKWKPNLLRRHGTTSMESVDESQVRKQSGGSTNAHRFGNKWFTVVVMKHHSDF